jgi:hypothetical protein
VETFSDELARYCRITKARNFRPFAISHLVFSKRSCLILSCRCFAGYQRDALKRVLENIRPYLVRLIIYRKLPPLLNGHIDWTMISQACGIEAELTAELKKQPRPSLHAIIRWLGASAAEERRPPKPTVSSSKMAPAKKAASARSARQPQLAAVDDICDRKSLRGSCAWWVGNIRCDRSSHCPRTANFLRKQEPESQQSACNGFAYDWK